MGSIVQLYYLYIVMQRNNLKKAIVLLSGHNQFYNKKIILKFVCLQNWNFQLKWWLWKYFYKQKLPVSF